MSEMRFNYDADDYSENKELLKIYLEEYTRLLTEEPALKVLSFDAYLGFVLRKNGIENTNDLLFDTFHHLRRALPVK